MVKVDEFAIKVSRASDRIYIALIEDLLTVASVFTHLIPNEKTNQIIFIANQHIPYYSFKCSTLSSYFHPLASKTLNRF
jgi:hypothetical protein